MTGRIVAFVLFAVSALAARPLDFRTLQRLPSGGYGAAPAGALPLLTANGEGFVALSGNTVVELDDAGRTLRRVAFPAALNVSPASLWPLGRDTLVATAIAPAWIVDGGTMAIRQLPAAFSYPAAMASNGSTILVLESGARATLLDRNGTALSRTTLLTAAQGLGAVTSDGVDYAVVWNDGATIRTVFLDAAGNARLNLPLWPLDVPESPFFPPRIAFAGGKLLVVWNDHKNLYARVTSDYGLPLAPAIVLDANFGSARSAAWDGREFLVTFGSRIARIGSDGKLLEPPRQLDAGPGRVVESAVVAANARAAIVIRRERCPCSSCDVLTIGPIDGPSAPFAAEERDSSNESAVVAATEEATVVAYEEKSDAARVRIAFAPIRGPSIGVPSARGTQSQPAIATDGVAFLVTWLENDDDCHSQVVAAVMDASGRFGPVVQLSDAEVASSAPAVTWNGREYAVVWKLASRMQLAGIRITSFGRPIGTPVRITEEEPAEVFSPTIAWSGRGYVAGWSLQKSVGAYPYTVYEYRLRRLGADLQPLAAELVLGPGDAGSVAWNGSEAVVFFRSGTRMEMATLDADGNPGPRHYVPVFLPSYGEPSLAWRNGEWLVTGISTNGGRVARVTPDGQVVEDIDLFDGDDKVPLFRTRVAATPSRVAAIVETWNPPRVVTVMTTNAQPPRHRAAR